MLNTLEVQLRPITGTLQAFYQQKFKKHKKTWKIFTLEEKRASQDDKKFKRVGSIQNTGTLQKF